MPSYPRRLQALSRWCLVLSLPLLALSGWSIPQAFRWHQSGSIRRLEAPAADFLRHYRLASHLEVVQQVPLRLVVTADCDRAGLVGLEPALRHLYAIRDDRGEAITVVAARRPFYWVDHPQLAIGLAGLGLLLAFPGLALALTRAWTRVAAGSGAAQPAPPPRRRRRIYTCVHCDEVFIDEESLDKHLLRDHGNSPKPKPERKSPNPGRVLLLTSVWLLAGATGFLWAQWLDNQAEPQELGDSLCREITRLVEAPVVLAVGERTGELRILAAVDSGLRPLIQERALALGAGDNAIYFVAPPSPQTAPRWPYLLGLAGLAWWLPRPRFGKPAAAPIPAPEPQAPTPLNSPEQFMQVDGLSVEVGRKLTPSIPRLLERMDSIRCHLALELGLPLPRAPFRENLLLGMEAYVIKVRELEVARGEVVVGHYLAIGPEEKLRNLRGTRTVDPSYGLPGKWVSHEQRGEAERLGCMIFDPVSVLATQLTEVIRAQASRLLTFNNIHQLLSQPELVPVVEHLRLRGVDQPLIGQVLISLLEERVSIRDLTLICDSLLMSGASSREGMLEQARIALGCAIAGEYCNSEGVLNCLVLTEEQHQVLRAGADPTALLERLRSSCQDLRDRGLQPVLVTEPDCRVRVRDLLKEVVLSRAEIPAQIQVHSVV